MYMSWLAAALALVVLAAIVLLASPIKIRAVWNDSERKIRIRYLCFGQTTDLSAATKEFDLLGLRLYRAPLIAPKKKPKPSAKPKAIAKKPTAKKSWRRIVSTLYAHRRTVLAALKRVLVYLGRLVVSPRLGLLRLEIIAGSGNPATTGMYYGWYQSVRAAWAAKRVVIDWYPVFDRARFAFSLDARVWLRPWYPVKHTVRLIHELPKFALYRLYKQIRTKEA
jgi:hypothetical protein